MPDGSFCDLRAALWKRQLCEAENGDPDQCKTDRFSGEKIQSRNRMAVPGSSAEETKEFLGEWEKDHADGDYHTGNTFRSENILRKKQRQSTVEKTFHATVTRCTCKRENGKFALAATVKKSGSVSAVLKKLDRKTDYYVKVRSFKTAEKKTVYSTFSKARKVRTK